jgi:DNA polymerase I
MNLMDLLKSEDPSQITEFVTPEELEREYKEDKPRLVAFDTESPSYKWHLPENEPFAVSFSWGIEDTWFMPLKNDDGELDEAAVRIFYGIVTSAPELVAHNLKYDLHVARRIFRLFNLPLVTRVVHDTMLMSHVLNEQRSHALKSLCTELDITYTGEDADALKERIEEWIEQEKNNTGVEPGYDQVPASLMVPYATQDAYLTLELYRRFQLEMKRQTDEGLTAGRVGSDVRNIYQDVELPVLWVYTAAEERGMRVDLDFVYERIAELTPVMANMKAELSEDFGFDFNPGSSDDVAKAIIQAGLAKETDFTNARTGKPNLPEWVLEKLDDPLAGKVLAYRNAQKMVGSYFEVMAKEAREDETGQHIIRCNIKQVGARTGRSSVTEPAMQTLPVRGRAKAANVRGAIIAREGHKLLFADYSGQELCVLGHYLLQVGDGSMKEIIAAGRDPHAEAAAAIFKLTYDECAKGGPNGHLRDMAKNVNFGIIYGAGLDKVGSMLNCTREEAQELMNTRYYKRFPGLRTLKKRTEEAMRSREYIITVFGRRHREKNGKFAYRAINSLVQGTSADLTKAAIVKADARFRAENLRAMVLLSVHDEIIVEAPDEEVDRTGTLLLEAMLDFPEIRVPLGVDISVATRWSDAK